MNRLGDWIQTYTGIQFWPLDPRPEEVDWLDVAHALSMTCRYGGHCKQFYSVAQHSCLVSDQCSEPNKLWGLLHDAPEAYLVDLPRPIKRAWRKSGFLEFDNCESALMSVIAVKAGLNTVEPEEVKEKDYLLLATEARDLMAPLHPDWHHQRLNGYPVLTERISPWTPGRACQEFLDRLRVLEVER